MNASHKGIKFAVKGVIISVIIAGISYLSFIRNDDTRMKKFQAEQSMQNEISLEKIINDSKEDNNDSLQKSDVRLIFTGDTVLARSVNFIAAEKGDYSYPFSYIKPLFKRSDVVMVNLESAVMDDCIATKEKVGRFCGGKEWARAMSEAGITHVNTANNHIHSDFGTEGYQNTIGSLEKYNIEYSDSDDITFYVLKNVKFAFVGFNDIGQTSDNNDTLIDRNKMSEMIRKASKTSDFVIVSIHWGVQYSRVPTARQREIGRIAIESGADIVVGHHPHWVQPVEVYKDGVIFYSLGNFIFDMDWSDETSKGIILEIITHGQGLNKVMIHPVLIKSGIPGFIDGQNKTAELNKLGILSRNFAK